jgi:hypothetical protein
MRSPKTRFAALAFLALATAVWLAAPAFSLRQYQPEPVDFELSDSSPLATHQASAARGARLTVVHSRLIRAPKRFNLVGLRWRGPREAKLVIRARRDGGRWTPWVRVGVDSDDSPDAGSPERRRHMALSDPLWVGEADQLEYRVAARRLVRGVTIHFVNAKGTATAFDRLRSGLRHTVNGAVRAVGAIFGASARAQEIPTQPEIVSRNEWGASACKPRATPAYGEVKMAFVHHTVTANDYAPEDSAAIVLGICRYHRNSNGWNDIGYQFLVDKYGQIFEGRAGGVDQAVVGAQAQGYNAQSTGVANLGTFSVRGQTEAGLAALARLLTWKLALHGVLPQSQVVLRSAGGATNRFGAGTDVTLNAISGHRDADATSCPGDGLYEQLPRLRSLVSPDPRAPTTLAAASARRRLPYGRRTKLEGKLTAADGSPLAGRTLSVRTISPSGSANTVTSVPTGQGGSFISSILLPFNRVLRVEFGGEATLRPALSRLIRIGVRPRVTATLRTPVDGAVRRGGRVLLAGGVQPRKRTALLIVDRRKSTGSYRRIAKVVVPARRGHINASYRFAHAGGYRLRLGVDADGRNLSARSDPITVKVR